MVQIHRASRKTNNEFIEVDMARFYAGQAAMNLAGKDVVVTEFPAPDGSVELVAEVVTMTKQDYDDLLTYLVCFKLSNDGNQQLLAGEIYRMLTGKSMWA